MEIFYLIADRKSGCSKNLHDPMNLRDSIDEEHSLFRQVKLVHRTSYLPIKFKALIRGVTRSDTLYLHPQDRA